MSFFVYNDYQVTITNKDPQKQVLLVKAKFGYLISAQNENLLLKFLIKLHVSE